MTALFALAAALLSVAVLALFLVGLGAKMRLGLDAAAAGAALGATVAVALSPFELKTNPMHFSAATLAFLFAGLPEEAIKMLGFAAFLRGHWRANGVRDVTLAAGALALGFAALENFLYVSNAGTEWASLAAQRAATATPLHVLLGLAGGYVVARAPADRRGVALGLLAWGGLALVHGVYDFAVFADAPGAVRPLGFDAAVAALGFDRDAMLRVLLIGAEAAAAFAAAAVLRAVGRAPGMRALGASLAVTLIGGACLAAFAGGLATYALDAWAPLGNAADLVVLPLAVGVLSIPERRALSRRRVRWLAGAATAATFVAAVAAFGWGPTAVRRLDMMRAETRGARLFARRDYGGAIEAFGRAIAFEPARVEPLSQRAAAYAAARRFPDALADLDHALQLAPMAPLYGQRAEVNRQRNQPAAALADYDAAVRLDGANPLWLALRAKARLETGDAPGAYADVAEASRSAPNDATVRRNFAAWDVDAGDFDAAIRDLNARLHDDPNDFEAKFQRGRALFYKGDFAHARDDFAAADAGQTGFYPALWLSLTQVRLHDAEGDALRRRLAAAPVEWPAPVARMLLGEIDLHAARALGANDEERCEADFYFAASRLGDDPSDASAARLRAALAECPTSFIEYEGAKAELRRLAL